MLIINLFNNTAIIDVQSEAETIGEEICLPNKNTATIVSIIKVNKIFSSILIDCVSLYGL